MQKAVGVDTTTSGSLKVKHRKSSYRDVCDDPTNNFLITAVLSLCLYVRLSVCLSVCLSVSLISPGFWLQAQAPEPIVLSPGQAEVFKMQVQEVFDIFDLYKTGRDPPLKVDWRRQR